MATFAGCSCTASPSMCAIDLGSNNFRPIVGTFEGGRYVETAGDRQCEPQ